MDPSAVQETFANASFEHAASGFEYGISVTGSGYTVRFAKPGGLSGEKALAYSIGSGVRARSYLLEQDGFLFEAPVAYYTAEKAWRLAPGYDHYDYPYLTRPIMPGCLSCHSSSLQVKPPSLNQYGDPPFLDGGVTCERCHGNGEKHVEKMRRGNVVDSPVDRPEILNPAKLTAERRDSVCARCHLTGEVSVMRAGTNWSSFQPGDRLRDSLTVFVRSGQRAGVKVTGHVEDLALSACKRSAGDKLWCGSCHDLHAVPEPGQAAAWFRAKCLSCHATDACKEKTAVRSRVQDDCVSCHMPKSQAVDAEHVVFTDHSIPRRPRKLVQLSSDAELVTFGGPPASLRDLALAYAIKSIGQQGGADRSRALELLVRAERETPNDVDVLVSLAERYRNDGKSELAYNLYERALAIEPRQATAAVGLGGIMMERGNYGEAMRLWTIALSQNSGLELVRLNFAVALLRSGQRDAAIPMLEKRRV